MTADLTKPEPARPNGARPDDGDPLLRVTGLTRLFGRGKNLVRAVDDVSFELRAGEITTVVGESGSSKSTLARLVLRLMPPTAGQIELAGRAAW